MVGGQNSYMHAQVINQKQAHFLRHTDTDTHAFFFDPKTKQNKTKQNKRISSIPPSFSHPNKTREGQYVKGNKYY